MLIDIAINSVPTAIVFVYAVLHLKDNLDIKRNMFLLGLVLVLLTALIAPSFSFWVFRAFPKLLELPHYVAIGALPLNMLAALGLFLCVKAVIGSKPNA